MNKTCLIIGLFLAFTLTAFAVEEEVYTKVFVSRFLKCIPCVMNQTITVDGEVNNISRKIAGWHGHKCTYREVITPEGGESTSASCELSREQVNELVSAMRNDPQGKSTAKSTWKKIMNNKDVCKFD